MRVENPVISDGEILVELRKFTLLSVKNKHAKALLVLTDSATPEERDTWPSKAKYAEIQSVAAASGEDTSVDGFGLSDTQKANVQQALLPGETVNEYLAKTAARVKAFESLAFFAEGFKRKTEKAIEAAETVEAIGSIMDQAAADMAQAMAAFQAQLNA